jgi:DNA-binding beta-propeller fold protein YncE
MANRIWRILTLACVAAFLLSAQQGRVAGPSSGFVFDSSTSALRPILGIPGASVIGDPLKLGFDLASASVAPRQDSALVTASDGGSRFLRLTAGAVTERAVDGLLGAPERVAFSPSGTAAALYAAGKTQVLTGLPDSPVVAGTLDLDGTPSALAVSDDGSYLLFATAGSIRLLGIGGDNRKLMDAADGALAAFAPGGHDAAVSDPGGAGIVLFRDLAGASQQTIVAPPDDAIASPAGLAFSADGRKLFLASAAARSVAAFDLQTGGRAAIACNCVPAGLVSMGNLFRLSEPGPAPLWLFDGSAAPRIVFVPAPSAR